MKVTRIESGMATEMIRVLVRFLRNSRITAAARRDPWRACSMRFRIDCRIEVDWSNEIPNCTPGGMPGASVRTIERFAASMMTDCAVVQTDAAGKATWTGLDHLEG